MVGDIEAFRSNGALCTYYQADSGRNAGAKFEYSDHIIDEKKEQ